MEFINETRLGAGYTVATDKEGVESLVIVVKGRFDFPAADGGPVTLSSTQAGPAMVDVFAGDPAVSAPLQENDFAPVKRRCDVLLLGTCHAPEGRPSHSVDVGVRCGAMNKMFRVVGPRYFRSGGTGWRIDGPRPFVTQSVSYEEAYGGVARVRKDPTRDRWYLSNPVGIGFHCDEDSQHLDGKPLPRTEEIGDPVVRPDGDYRPMAFGPLGRSWKSRLAWAGTYDQGWLDAHFPFLPPDFDERYFQSAPEEQQIDHPQGGETVVLLNLTPEGRTVFRLPADLQVPVLVFVRGDEIRELATRVDTITLEPDLRRLSLVWRASLPLRRNVREVLQVRIGQNAARFERRRAFAERLGGKRRFRSLADLVAWNQARALDGARAPER